MPAIPAQLKQHYARIDACARCAREGNTLRHVHGGGKFERPKFFFLFINPTHKNLSSSPAYPGERRYPFIGVRHLYKGLSDAGFVDPNIIANMYARGWQTPDEHAIEASLREHDVYITNFVKCARPNPINPTRYVMREDVSLIAEELAIVQPQYIVTFGALPLEVITGKSFRMRDILATVENGTYAPIPTPSLNGAYYKILPCFYPLGHGNPPKAHKILAYIKHTF